jgi:chromosome segregation ATPase
MQALLRVRQRLRHASAQRARLQAQRDGLKQLADAKLMATKQLKRRRDARRAGLQELQRSDVLTEPLLLAEYWEQLRLRQGLRDSIARLQAEHAAVRAAHDSASETTRSVSVRPALKQGGARKPLAAGQRAREIAPGVWGSIADGAQLHRPILNE